ncbi:MAG: hypothetical protein GY792_00870 [Gammaproteobacteria bacterium]|nr:hypothetical protein [Gammaproteobacteria bacterium]
MPLKISTLSINLPFGIGGISIDVDEAQQQAAWALYVEMATRIASVELEPGMGSAREALNSLYSIFSTTRTVLKDAGPGAANGPDSVGPIAIEIINQGLRPFVVEWHSRLSNFESEQTKGQRNQFGGKVTMVIDEALWSDLDDFYKALNELRQAMLIYVDALARIAGIHHETKDISGVGLQ